MLLAIELLRAVDTKRLERANNTFVVTFTVNPGRDPVARPIAEIVATTTCPPPHGSGRTHRVEARLYAPSGQRMPSWVTCTCEDLCVSGDTRISTTEGIRRIAEVVDQTVVVNTRHGPKQARVFATGRAATWRVRVEGGLELRATATEKFWVLNPDLSTSWKTLKDLRPGDYIAAQPGALDPEKVPTVDFVPTPVYRNSYYRKIAGRRTRVSGHECRQKPQRVPKQLTPALARVLGYLTAEGWTDRNTIVFAQLQGEVYQSYQRDFRVCFPDAHQTEAHAGVGCRSTVLASYLAFLGYRIDERSRAKSVPDIVWQAPNHLVREYLRAYYEGDGGCTSKQVYARTTSKELAEEIQQLLLRFGLLGRVSYVPARGPDAASYNVLLSGVDARLFRKRIGFVSRRKNSTATNGSRDRGLVIPHARTAIRSVLTPTGYYQGRRLRLYTKVLDSTAHATGMYAATLSDYVSRYGAALRLVDPGLCDRIESVLRTPVRWLRVEFKGDRKTVDTYDATVMDKETPEFVANGIVVHNTYRWETVLTRQDSSSLLHSNGAWPVVTNPGGRKAVCVTLDTLVETSRGLCRAADVRVGDRLLSMYGKYHQVTNLRDVRKCTRTLTTDKGYRITCSPTHEVLVLTRQLDLEWKPTSEVVVGDTLCVSMAPRLTRDSDSDSVARARICGHLVAEGSGLSYINTNPELLDDYAAAWRQLGVSTRRHESKSRLSKVPCFVVTPRTEDIPKDIDTWYQSVRSGDKHVPEWLWKAGTSCQTAFIRSYWEGDGSISKDGNVFTAASKSERLIREIQILLLHLRIFSSVRPYTISSLAPSGKCRMWYLRICGTDANRFRDLIGTVSNIRNQRVKQGTGRRRTQMGLPGAREQLLAIPPAVPLLYAPCDLSMLSTVRWSEIRPLVVAGDGLPGLQPSRYEPRIGGGGKKEKVYDAVKLAEYLSRCPICPFCGRRIATRTRPIQHFDTCGSQDQYEAAIGCLAPALRTTYGLGSRLPIVAQSGRVSLRTFLEIAKDASYLQAGLYIKAARLAQARLLFCSVSGIEEGPKQPLRDFTVSHSEHFIANGLVVHNCKHVARVLSRAIRDSKVVAAIRGLPQAEVTHSRYPRPELKNQRKIS